MKTKAFLAIIFIMLFSFSGIGQEKNDAFAKKINQIFSRLEKSKIPHHLLKDYAMEFIDIEQYDGNLPFIFLQNQP